MFKFNELKMIHLEITTRCQASCPMCPRNYHGGVDNSNLKIADWTFEEFKTVFTDTLLNQVSFIYFCGNFGDPIMNNDLIKMCQYVKDKKKEISIEIHTNGGARSTQWWEELYDALPEKHRIFFGIDGLADTNHIYRIGVNYEAVIRNASAFIKKGGNAEWVFIRFKHNEHQEISAQMLSKQIGFKNFIVKNTNRFIGDDKYSVLDKDGNVDYYLNAPTNNEVVLIPIDMVRNYKAILKHTEIDCLALNSKEIYIDAHKQVYPCCYLASKPYLYFPPAIPKDELNAALFHIHHEMVDQQVELVTSLGGEEKLSALNYSVKDIISSDEWQSVWGEYWGSKKLVTCGKVCGKTPTSKTQDQVVKTISN